MTLDLPTGLAIGGIALGVGGLFFIALNWNELIDECFDDWSADSRTTGLVNDVFHNGTDNR